MPRIPLGVSSCVLLVVLIVATGASAPAASAAPGVQFGLTDDAWLVDGPGTLQARLARLHALGVGIVRFTVHWDQVAPRRPATPTNPLDPANDWAATDAVVKGLRSHRIGALLQLVGTPSWANGGRSSNYAPTSANAFGSFATAAARHYPWVRDWLIWNEPNQARWLRPTTAAVYTKHLLNPAYVAIH